MITSMQFQLKGSEIIELLRGRVTFHQTKLSLELAELKIVDDAITVAVVSVAKIHQDKRSLEKSIEFHRNQSIRLAFYAKYIVSDEIYMLSENDLIHYELLVFVYFPL